VLEEGDVAAGDQISLLQADEMQIPVTEITRLYLDRKSDPQAMRRLIQVKALPEDWREYFTELLENLSEDVGAVM
ncbi:MAG TPA: 3-alpha domain-containing protein, partial [Ktedonobacteraceae bacterium]|nr:3-alpha domain-containing protein [Ktedonobacteraceae bacterium]